MIDIVVTVLVAVCVYCVVRWGQKVTARIKVIESTAKEIRLMCIAQAPLEKDND